MKKVMLAFLCLMMCTVAVFAEETETVGGQITLTQFLGVSREDAEGVMLSANNEKTVNIDKNAFFDISDSLTLTSAVEPKQLEFSGLYITVIKTDGEYTYTFISDDGGVDRYGALMSRMPYALYTVDNPERLSDISALAKPRITVNDNAEISAEGKKINFVLKPFIDENGRTLVPAREICGYLNKRIYWFDSPSRVAVSSVPADLNNADGGGAGGDSICFEIGEKNYEINGRLHETDTAAQLIDGNAYIPLRALAEFLGYRVEYTPSTNL